MPRGRSAAIALADPGILNHIMEGLDRKNVHRMAATSGSFAKAATRYDDSRIRKLRELESQQAELQLAVKRSRSQANHITKQYYNALQDLEDVLEITFPDQEWSNETVQAVALVIEAFERDPTSIVSLVLRLATLGEGLMDAMDSGVPDTQWFRDAKVEYNELGAALSEVTKNLEWPFFDDSSSAAKFLTVAPSLVKLCRKVTQHWYEMADVVAVQDQNTELLVELKQSMQTILLKMDDPLLGLVNTSLKKDYHVPALSNVGVL